ncbi:hypothetical protein PybrP1_013173 [[Pythium] brassicae (nom. inval.)]|nr:hypothetical protein PybrP1_013173 [[Pythium] brassicae (nom. inval.)]
MFDWSRNALPPATRGVVCDIRRTRDKAPRSESASYPESHVALSVRAAQASPEIRGHRNIPVLVGEPHRDCNEEKRRRHPAVHHLPPGKPAHQADELPAYHSSTSCLTTSRLSCEPGLDLASAFGRCR